MANYKIAVLKGDGIGPEVSNEAIKTINSIGKKFGHEFMIYEEKLGGEGDRGLYEAIHGSAPDIAGKYIANPIAAILSVAMMMKYSFKLEEAWNLIENSVKNILKQGYRTLDIVGESNDNKNIVGTKMMSELIRINMWGF